jgi:hypothetical protein
LHHLHQDVPTGSHHQTCVAAAAREQCQVGRGGRHSLTVREDSQDTVDSRSKRRVNKVTVQGIGRRVECNNPTTVGWMVHLTHPPRAPYAVICQTPVAGMVTYCTPANGVPTPASGTLLPYVPAGQHRKPQRRVGNGQHRVSGLCMWRGQQARVGLARRWRISRDAVLLQGEQLIVMSMKRMRAHACTHELGRVQMAQAEKTGSTNTLHVLWLCECWVQGSARTVAL